MMDRPETSLAVRKPLQGEPPAHPWTETQISNQDESFFRRVLDTLPAAIYTTDSSGQITYYNEAAADLWGHRPELGTSKWCGSWKLFWPDGRPMPHEECPMAVALREKRAVRNVEAVAERPDGRRVPFVPYPTPIFDQTGTLTGAVNMLVGVTDRQSADSMAAHLAAVVASSSDAIVSKDLNGVIQTWNEGAEKLFGYTAEEAIGKSVTILIPPDRIEEEANILARIRRGERVGQYETVRRRKDGGLVEVSLTVSPIRNARGTIVGASKLARDITERRQAQERQKLLLREMEHRIRNLFTLANSVVSLSAQFAKSPADLAAAIQRRLAALARAHALSMAQEGGGAPHGGSLRDVIQAVLSPYEGPPGAERRISTDGPDLPVGTGAVAGLTLLLHEFATNAAKYGALSVPEGRVAIAWRVEGERVRLTWTERGGPPVRGPGKKKGFGREIAGGAAGGYLGGGVRYDWAREGVTITLDMARDRLT